MPITRRDDTKDPLDPYILLIWEKKWLIAAVSITTAVLVFFALWFVPSTFQANSEIFVNRLSSATDGVTPNPDTVVSLLKSHSVIEKVRNDYVKAFDLEANPPVERFAKQFEVETHILQDTTVQKEFSPVISLQVESKGASETRYIMERWIRNFISEFGNYTSQESVLKREALLLEKNKLENEIARVERLQADAESNLPYLRKILAEKLDLLSPSRLTLREPESDKITLDLNMRSPRMMPGLLERYNEIVLRTRAGDTVATATSELDALTLSIEDAQSSVTAAENKLAEGIFSQMATERQLTMLRDTQTAINEALSRFTVASAAYQQIDADGALPTGGDIRALSMPVMPESRVWPKRTISAGVAGLAAGILTIFFILARNFLTKILPHPRQ